MPFMTGNVVYKRLCKIVCNFELVFGFFTPTEPVTGPFLVLTVTFHTVKYGTHIILRNRLFY